MQLFCSKIKIIVKLFSFMIVIFLSSTNLSGHEQSVAKINVFEVNKQAYLNWQLGLNDLTRVIDLDFNKDGELQWKEILFNHVKIEQFINRNIKLSANNRSCPLRLVKIELIEISSGNGLALKTKLACQNYIEAIEAIEAVEYLFLKTIDSLHVASFNIKLNNFSAQFLFKQKARIWSLNDSSENLSETESFQFIQFVRQGIYHIWIGLDHLAFLVVLLLSAMVMSYRQKQSNTKPPYKKILLFVSAFTVAHTITLLSASMNWVQLPSWLVESIIALSVAWGAFSLIFKLPTLNTSTVFNFGLIHGLGFASVLSDLTGNISESVGLLLGFNLGVEIGQIAFLAFIMAILYWPLRRYNFNLVVKLICWPILMISLLWFCERVSIF